MGKKQEKKSIFWPKLPHLTVIVRLKNIINRDVKRFQTRSFFSVLFASGERMS